MQPVAIGATPHGATGTSGIRSSHVIAANPRVHPASAAGNPTRNIAPSPAFPDRCIQAYQSAECTTSVVAALNNARHAMALPNYALPANFAVMPPAYQFLALSNADRKLAGLTAVTAFNPTLNAVAQASANSGGDPSAASIPTRIGTQSFRAWTANWAGGMSPLEAYYDWMYDDGPGSNNIDCAIATDAGCWGHRENTLWNFGAGIVYGRSRPRSSTS